MDRNPYKDYDKAVSTVGFEDSDFAESFASGIKERVIERCKTNNVETVYEVEVHSQEFTHYNTDGPVVNIWVTGHSNDGKTLPRPGFTKGETAKVEGQVVEYELDIRRF